jgi:hypothetical protein
VELLVKNVKIVNVFSEEIHQTDVDITDGIFVGFGGEGYNTKSLYDAQGRCICFWTYRWPYPYKESLLFCFLENFVMWWQYMEPQQLFYL